MQLYAAAGYVVLYSNPRGSTSYGEEFANLIDKDYPGHDYDDLISAVDAAVATGFVDPNNVRHRRIGRRVLTAWIVGKTNRFRAAATRPVINYLSFALTQLCRGYSPAWRKERPWEDPMSYWKYSPLSLVGNPEDPRPWSWSAARITAPRSADRAILYRASDARRADRIGEGARRRMASPPGPPVGGKGGAIIA